MTGVRLRVVDAFTNHAGYGNPAGVVLLEPGPWPAEPWMRLIAAELRLSETAFAKPASEPVDPEWDLRWFTPVVETDLCGHATLATAHVIATEAHTPQALRFTTHSGVLPVTVAADGTITLDFPAATLTETPAPRGLAAGLGTTVDTTYTTGALRDLLVIVDTETSVRALTPDLGAIAALTRRENIRGITVTAAAQTPSGNYDFVSRFFSPADGIPEDPVTGSAHTALAPYWTERLGRAKLTGLQASARTGLVQTEVRDARILLTGNAITVIDGTWLQPAPPT